MGSTLRAFALCAPAVFLVAFAADLAAGTLNLGEPTIEGEQYTFPVRLENPGDAVAALDFRVRFDPDRFQPIDATAGAAAVSANKLVTSNAPVPGELIVVMMGLNQHTLDGGEVARVVLRRVGEATDSAARISVTDTTLATVEGFETPSTGSSWELGAAGDADGQDTAEETGQAVDPAEPASTETAGPETVDADAPGLLAFEHIARGAAASASEDDAEDRKPGPEDAADVADSAVADAAAPVETSREENGIQLDSDRVPEAVDTVEPATTAETPTTFEWTLPASATDAGVSPPAEDAALGTGDGAVSPPGGLPWPWIGAGALVALFALGLAIVRGKRFA